MVYLSLYHKYNDKRLRLCYCISRKGKKEFEKSNNSGTKRQLLMKQQMIYTTYMREAKLYGKDLYSPSSFELRIYKYLWSGNRRGRVRW